MSAEVIVAMAQEIHELKREIARLKDNYQKHLKRNRASLETLDYLRNFNHELVAAAEYDLEQNCLSRRNKPVDNSK